MLILYNGRIYTQDPQTPLVSALAIQGEKILSTGEDHTVLSEFHAHRQVEVVNLEGRTVLPGLTDSHIHLENYALGQQKIDCETATMAECLERVAERARKTPPGEWILGHGWNQNRWEGGFGTAADLDQAAPVHPVYLTAKSLHAAWANTTALRKAGLDERTPDPQDGQIGRLEDGKLNGLLFEEAMELMGEALPEPTVEQVVEAIREVQPILWSLGLTGAHDFDRRRCFKALQILHERGQQGLRVVKSIPVEDLQHALEVGLRTGFGSALLRIGSVKLFADGALGPQTAAMLHPYENDPSNQGMLMLDSEELFETGCKAVQGGLSLAVHAIGDRANHEVLTAFGQLRQFEKEKGLPAFRHRIEHVQVLHPDDASRLAEFGVIASMQPIHATSDMEMADRYWGERSALSYAWRTQLNYGASLAFGSDAPVESPNPFWGLHAAVTRRRLDGAPGPQGWRPGEALNLAEALAGYTSGAAYTAGLENSLGRLAPGFFADLIMMETDPFQVELEQLPDLRPSATMVAGEWVWQA